MATKKQKSLSFPQEYYIEFEKLFQENKERFQKYGIDSISELIRILAVWGKEPLLKALELDHTVHKTKDQDQPET